MKTLHKGIVGFLALSAVGFTALSAVALRSSASAPVEKTVALEAARSGLSAAVAEGDEAAALKLLAEQAVRERRAEEKSVAVPEGLQATVKTTPKGRVLSLSHRGHIVALRSAGERRAGMNKVEWTQGPALEKLVWETTDAKTLDTVRGEITWDEAAGKVAVASAVVPAVVTEEISASHACRGMSDGGSGFVVVCRVSGQAAAASVESKDPKEGVWSQAGDATAVRFDLPMNGEGVDTKVIGFEKGGKGVLVRVEASRVAGETGALLAIGADSRAQPHPVRRLGCICVF